MKYYMWLKYSEEYGTIFSFHQSDDSRIHFRRPKQAFCGWNPEKQRFFCGKKRNHVRVHYYKNNS